MQRAYLFALSVGLGLVAGCDVKICEDPLKVEMVPSAAQTAAFLRKSWGTGEEIFQGEFPHGVWRDLVQDDYPDESSVGGAGGETGIYSHVLSGDVDVEFVVDPGGEEVLRSYENDRGQVVEERWAAVSSERSEGASLCTEFVVEDYQLTLDEVLVDGAVWSEPVGYSNFEVRLEMTLNEQDELEGYRFTATQHILVTDRQQEYAYREVFLPSSPGTE